MLTRFFYFHPDPIGGTDPELDLEPVVDPPKPTDPPVVTGPDLATQIKRSFADGRGEGRKQERTLQIEELKRLGIPLVKNDKNEVDIAKSIEQFRNSSYNAEEIVNQIKREHERREETLATEVATLKNTLRLRDLNHSLQTLVTPHDPNDLDLAIAALQREYTIDEDENEGITIKHRDGRPVLDSDSGKYAPPDRIVEMFFSDVKNKWMIKAQRAGSGVGERDRKGTPKAISDEELYRELMAAAPGSPREAELRIQIMEREKTRQKN